MAQKWGSSEMAQIITLWMRNSFLRWTICQLALMLVKFRLFWAKKRRFFYFYIFKKCFFQKYIFGFTIYSFIPLPPGRGPPALYSLLQLSPSPHVSRLSLYRCLLQMQVWGDLCFYIGGEPAAPLLGGRLACRPSTGR